MGLRENMSYNLSLYVNPTLEQAVGRSFKKYCTIKKIYVQSIWNETKRKYLLTKFGRWLKKHDKEVYSQLEKEKKLEFSQLIVAIRSGIYTDHEELERLLDHSRDFVSSEIV